MTLYVLDASAWLRLFLHDGPVPAALESTAVQVERGEAAFAAPELILVEAAHALARKHTQGHLTAEESQALWADMRLTPIDLLPMVEDIDAARALAQTHRLSVYDALYLAAAIRIGAALFTADTDLARVAERLGRTPR